MNLRQLIALLKTKPHMGQVEFIVVTKSGKIIAMDIEANAKEMSELLKAFGNK